MSSIAVVLFIDLRFVRRFVLLSPLITVAIGCCLALVKKTERPSDHPFVSSVRSLDATRSASFPGDRRPIEMVATNTSRHPLTVETESGPTTVELTATAEVPPAHLELLMKTTRPRSVSPSSPTETSQSDTAFVSAPASLQYGEPEVLLPPLPSGSALDFSDAWEVVRPRVVRLKPAYRTAVIAPFNAAPTVTTAALTRNVTEVRGTLTCRPTGEPAVPLPFVTIEVGGTRVRANAAGQFVVRRRLADVDGIRIVYQGNVVAAHAAAPMMVMNEWHQPHHELIELPSGTSTTGVLNLGTVEATSLDCELFQLGTIALGEYLALMRSAPPAGGLRIKRWTGIAVGTPYAFYDYVVIANDFLCDYWTRRSRRSLIFHEFGHTIRHVADGDVHHWNWDNVRFIYARNHNGTEVFREPYAFNEGWAQYWRCTDSTRSGACPQITSEHPDVSFLDWNEDRIGERLLAMAAAVPNTHEFMVQVLINHREEIHQLRKFEEAYCKSAPEPNPFCRDHRPFRVAPPCPPGYEDDGLTCRRPNIIAKPSQGRGVGTLPIGCGTQRESAGLCYRACPPGFDGVGPVCWEQCPAGYHDDGAFCRKDVRIVTADTSECPWYDACGLTFAQGCSECPPRFHNDGCFCRRNAHIFVKQTRGRGVGTIPNECPPGKEYDAGLCYPRCTSGFVGVGPLCWGSCPEGWDDHGATCYRPPSIIAKF